MIRHIEEGDGWRLGWNPGAEEFCGLVAGDRWSIELTTVEFIDFCRIARQLNQTMHEMSAHLMAEEHLSCEHETEHIWMETEGFPNDYSLHFILQTGRKGEGEWLPSQVQPLMAALMRSPFSNLL
ncbi:MAG: DUF1818 family protein [Cyanobacteria bacterium P01_D01_bin.105]